MRVHHFARQLASPFPLLAAIGARTSRIEIGTAVIDMRYENPLYMAEDAGAADLIAGGRLQLGISRGSPEPALRGAEAFGHVPREGETDADLAREHTRIFRHAIQGAGVAALGPDDDRHVGRARHPAPVPGPRRPDLVGLGHAPDRAVGGRAGHEPAELDAAVRGHRRAVRRPAGRADQPVTARPGPTRAGAASRACRSAAASSRSSTDEDRRYFGARAATARTRSATSRASPRGSGAATTAEPDIIAEELAADAAVREADTLLLTVPNQLGVEYNARMLRDHRRAHRSGDRLERAAEPAAGA